MSNNYSRKGVDNFEGKAILFDTELIDKVVIARKQTKPQKDQIQMKW